MRFLLLLIFQQLPALFYWGVEKYGEDVLKPKKGEINRNVGLKTASPGGFPAALVVYNSAQGSGHMLALEGGKCNARAGQQHNPSGLRILHTGC